MWEGSVCVGCVRVRYVCGGVRVRHVRLGCVEMFVVRFVRWCVGDMCVCACVGTCVCVCVWDMCVRGTSGGMCEWAVCVCVCVCVCVR